MVCASETPLVVEDGWYGAQAFNVGTFGAFHNHPESDTEEDDERHCKEQPVNHSRQSAPVFQPFINLVLCSMAFSHLTTEYRQLVIILVHIFNLIN